MGDTDHPSHSVHLDCTGQCEELGSLGGLGKIGGAPQAGILKSLGMLAC